MSFSSKFVQNSWTPDRSIKTQVDCGIRMRVYGIEIDSNIRCYVDQMLNLFIVNVLLLVVRVGLPKLILMGVLSEDCKEERRISNDLFFQKSSVFCYED